MKKRILCLLALCGFVGTGVATVHAIAPTSNAIVVRAEDEEETTEEEVVEEVEETPTFKDEVVKYWETYVLPLFAGLSLASIVSLVGNILIVVLKNKATNNNIKSVDDLGARTNQYITEAKALLKEMDELKDTTKATLESYEKRAKDLIKVAHEQLNEIKKVEALREVNILIANMLVEIAKSDKNAVTSGLAKSLDELKTKLSLLG